MAIQTLQDLTGLPADAPLETVEKRFVELVKDRIQAVSSSFDEAAILAEDARLRELHILFFNHTIAWVGAQIKDRMVRKETDHADAAKLRKEARDVFDNLQKNIVEYSLCYMHLNRHMTLLREEMRQDADKYSIMSLASTKWTPDTGVMIGRYKQQQKSILDENRRFESARAALVQIDELMGSLRAKGASTLGKSEIEPFMRSLIASLRMSDFGRARKVSNDILSKIKTTSADLLRPMIDTIILLAESQSANLVGAEKKLVLSASEADTLIANNMRELTKVRAFMGKYHMPYLQYRLENLFYLKDKLMVVGSLESLMTLYIRLMRGLALPMPDIKAIRLYESEVVGRISYLMDGQFQEIPVIETRAQGVVAEFRASRAEYAEIVAMALPETEGEAVPVAVQA